MFIEGCLKQDDKKLLISNYSRLRLSYIAVIISLFFLFAFIVNGSMNVLLGLILVSLGFLSLQIYIKPKRKYFTPLILTIFFYLGYVLSLTNMLLDDSNISRTGFGSIGSFIFNNAQFAILIFVVFCGLSGIYFANMFSEKFISKRTSEIYLDENTIPLEKRTVIGWILIWFILSISIVFVLWMYGIGRIGMVNQVYLPFKLSGTLYYLKQIFIPLGGLVLLEICIRNNFIRWAIIVFVLLLFVGALGSISSASRGAFAFTVFPAFIYLFFTSKKNNINKKLFKQFILISAIGAAIIFSVVGLVREYAYSTGSWSVADIHQIIQNATSSDFGISYMLKNFILLLTHRIGGAQSLMAVISSNIEGATIPVMMFLGNMENNTSQSIMYSVTGFIPLKTNTLAYGTSYGMWGQLFLSKNYFVVFSGTFIYVFISICIEEVFIRKGQLSAALIVSILLNYQFWGSASLFQLSRFASIALGCYWVILYLNKKYKTNYY